MPLTLGSKIFTPLFGLTEKGESRSEIMRYTLPASVVLQDINDREGVGQSHNVWKAFLRFPSLRSTVFRILCMRTEYKVDVVVLYVDHVVSLD